MRKPSKRKTNPPPCAQCEYNKAALLDATKQYNEQKRISEFRSSLIEGMGIWAATLERGCEMNLAEYLKAQARISYWQTSYELMLRTCTTTEEEYRKADSALKAELLKTGVQAEEIAKLRIELAGATGEAWGHLAANGHLKDENEELRTDLAHSDAQRRMLERDILAQRDVLKRFAPWHVFSPALRRAAD